MQVKIIIYDSLTLQIVQAQAVRQQERRYPAKDARVSQFVLWGPKGQIQVMVINFVHIQCIKTLSKYLKGSKYPYLLA